MLSLRLALIPLVLSFAMACGDDDNNPSPTSPTPTPPSGTTASVSIPTGAESLGNRAYSPAEVAITPGTTVTWMNNDSTAHTSTSNSGVFNSGTIAAGGQFSFTFQNAGT